MGKPIGDREERHEGRCVVIGLLIVIAMVDIFAGIAIPRPGEQDIRTSG